MRLSSVCAVMWLAVSGCSQKKEVEAAAPSVDSGSAPVAKFDRLARLDFNLRAVERNLPLFWRADANHDKVLQPGELAVLWSPAAPSATVYVDRGAFTPTFVQVYESLLKPLEAPATPEEKARRQTVLLELEQGRPTLIESDFSSANAEDKALVQHMMKVAVLIEKLHGLQRGTGSLAAKVASNDSPSAALFFRNQGPECAAPKTEKSADCSALADRAKPVPGLYPAEIQKDPKFCEMLSKQKNAAELMGHFSVVVADGAGFKTVPYSEAYADDMGAVARELESAAAELKDDEAAFKTYLAAAAKAFRTNDWESADDAWAEMGVTNSKYFLRVAPDEVYYEPCAWKAGFAMEFARVNRESLEWQEKLEPVKKDMEMALAQMAGPPYKARDVKFKLPDFIEVVLNAGDARQPHGATIGQSLPNWGKVADRGGRTMVMTNLYTDEDSRVALKEQMGSLLCKATMEQASMDPKPALMSTVLHEAAHNLGPVHNHLVKGQTDAQIFGGKMTSTLEELKAQTSALFFGGWLAERKIITAQMAEHSHLRDVAWSFGHISRGMYSGDGQPKNYSQLASIQMGHLYKSGVLEWKAEEAAANGKDTGCFEVHLEKWNAAVQQLERTTLQIKSKGDKAGAEKLKATWVDADDGWKKMREVISERWLKAPKASFVYSIKL